MERRSLYETGYFFLEFVVIPYIPKLGHRKSPTKIEILAKIEMLVLEMQINFYQF